MKVYHVLIGVIIFVVFIIGMSSLLFDLQPYNDEVTDGMLNNFTAYDFSSAVDSDIDELENQSNQPGIESVLTEQNVYLKIWDAVKGMTQTFNAPKNIISLIANDFNLEWIIIWGAGALLALFILVKLTGRFFLDR